MAMTLVIGILIDDSTVVLENIERHHAAGEAPADAALNGRTEIGQAAIVITMVDVVVFLADRVRRRPSRSGNCTSSRSSSRSRR